MKQAVILEKVKELIGDSKVKAALFYTFNFDARFFENYICPIFIKDVEFGDNEIQNSILWKMYQGELPPITVLCDESMKGTQGPSLGYDIIPISLDRVNGAPSCFHAKHSFIVCEDGSMILITGSNNLTVSGWCRNIEGFDIRRFSYKIHDKLYPKSFLKSMRAYTTHSGTPWLTPDHRKLSAIKMVRSYLDILEDTNSKGIEYFSSHSDSFMSFIERLKTTYNSGDPFSKIEVIAPYMSNSEGHFERFVTHTECQDIRINIPFEGEDLVGMEQPLFETINQHPAYRWHYFKTNDGSKGFRFCHAKIYQLWGNEQVVTIVGSVNFTDAAFRGLKAKGNLESAIANVQPIDKARSLLTIPYDGAKLSFTQSKLEAEEEEVKRATPYDLSFTLDWLDGTLTIVNSDPDKQRGYVVFTDADIKTISIYDTERKVRLNDEQYQDILSTNMITVKTTNRSGDIYHYFITHVNIASRPLPSKYNISDSELFQLWAELKGADGKKAKSRIIDQFINRIVDEHEEDILANLQLTKSVLNQMASHLNGLLALHGSLMDNIDKLGTRNIKPRQNKVGYYLTADNVDTLVSYQRMISKLYKEEEINIGFYWLLLYVLKSYFYNNESLCNLLLVESKDAYASISRVLEKTIKNIEREMKNQGVENAKIKWLKSQVDV